MKMVKQIATKLKINIGKTLIFRENKFIFYSYFIVFGLWE